MRLRLYFTTTFLASAIVLIYSGIMLRVPDGTILGYTLKRLTFLAIIFIVTLFMGYLACISQYFIRRIHSFFVMILPKSRVSHLVLIGLWISVLALMTIFTFYPYSQQILSILMLWGDFIIMCTGLSLLSYWGYISSPLEVKENVKREQELSFSLRMFICVFTVLIFLGVWVTILPISGFYVWYFMIISVPICFVGIPRVSNIVGTFFLTLSMVSLLLIISDISLRVLAPGLLYYRPHEMFIHRWPPRPYLIRYKANVSYSGECYGDLAAFSGIETLREKRSIVFRTDAFGFRNDPSYLQQFDHYDAIILGDSFGVGNGTTQASTWGSLLISQYRLNVYNLSLPGGPWHHYLNLLIESERLQLRSGTVVLLALFVGNDLDDYYGKPDKLLRSPENNFIECYMQVLKTFRNRSPIKQLVQRQMGRSSTNKRPVIVKNVSFNPGQIAFLKSYVERANRSEHDIIEHSAFASFERTLDDLRRFCDQNSLILKIMLFPTKSEVYQWVIDDSLSPWSQEITQSGFSKVLQTYCTKNGLEYLDLKPFLIKSSREIFASSSQILWWRDDTHMNDMGHKAVATIVYEHLLN